MMQGEYLNQRFLIAMPGLEDPNFKRGVTLLCQHNADGALGININHATEMQLGDIFSQMEIECDNPKVGETIVLHGGPVQPERGFVLHDGHPQGPESQWESSIKLTDGLFLTTSRDVLIDMAKGEGPDNFLIALGYASWAAGQLEEELRENAWLNADADKAIIFHAPLDQRWKKALDSIGVNLNQLSMTGGHA